jgi:hypothetical protein
MSNLSYQEQRFALIREEIENTAKLNIESENIFDVNWRPLQAFDDRCYIVSININRFFYRTSRPITSPDVANYICARSAQIIKENIKFSPLIKFGIENKSNRGWVVWIKVEEEHFEDDFHDDLVSAKQSLENLQLTFII